jgi:hypothetical protein
MNRTRLVAVPLALILAGMLGGCAFPAQLFQGGGTTPTPTAVSAAEAATAFSDTICTFNDAAFAFDRTWSDLEAPLRDLQEAASLSRVEAEAAERQLQAVSWPADIADDVTVIEQYLRDRMEKLDSVISAESVDELDAVDFTTPEAVNTAAAEVEAFLELGADYCPAPEEPSDPAASLGGSTWTGTDSDGDETELVLGADGSASAKVGGAAFEGTWELAAGVLTVAVARTDNSLAFTGTYEPGADVMALSGTATNGHTWTVELLRS